MIQIADKKIRSYTLVHTERNEKTRVQSRFVIASI